MVRLAVLACAALTTLAAVVQAIPPDHAAKYYQFSRTKLSSRSYSSSNTTSSASNTSIIRGVNIGNWLVLEPWMNSTLFNGTNATDQYTFDECVENAKAKLINHWETYFTEADVQKIQSWGLNSLRIPIGYWAYSNDTTPYIRGADAYLEKAIGWARKYGLKVLVDCHGSPGSQNGFDNSGRAGAVKWQTSENLEKSISVLETIAKKYGAEGYADVVFGIELVNEPISWDQNNFNVTKTWAQKAYRAVRDASTNKQLMVIMHDGFMGPSEWTTVGSAINGNTTTAATTFAIDTHLYQNQVDSDSKLDQSQHIAKACNWTTTNLLPAGSNLPVFVGEFSAQTNICANPDGSTVAGKACYEDGCQCSSNVDIEDWSQPLIQATRRFLEAELDAFERNARGWFIWSYKGPGSWGLENVMKYGVLWESVTDRKYPGQCHFTTS